MVYPIRTPKIVVRAVSAYAFVSGFNLILNMSAFILLSATLLSAYNIMLRHDK
jgi:hypothetical protein